VNKFGGNLSEQTTLSGNIKYNWQLNSNKAAYFLEKIVPSLIFKKDQAIIAINWQKQRPEIIRDKRGRIQARKKSTIKLDVKVSSLLKALKQNDISAVIKNQKDLTWVITKLLPTKFIKTN